MGSEYDFALDMEAAQARMESILEDEGTHHEVVLDDLTNAEVLTLYSAVSMGLEEYHRDGNELQFNILRKQAMEIQEDASPLFEEMDDIQQQVMQNAPDGPSPSSPSRKSQLVQFLRSPFGNVVGDVTMQDRIWGIGAIMVFVMGVAAGRLTEGPTPAE